MHFPYEEFRSPARSLPPSLSVFLSFFLQLFEEDKREKVAFCQQQKQNDAGNVKESTKDNGGGGGGGEDNEKVERGGGVEGENEDIAVKSGDHPGTRATKSPTMRRKPRHADISVTHARTVLSEREIPLKSLLPSSMYQTRARTFQLTSLVKPFAQGQGEIRNADEGEGVVGDCAEGDPRCLHLRVKPCIFRKGCAATQI